MTGNKSAGKGSWGDVSVRPNSVADMSFGPHSLVRAENELFSDKINPARARTGSLIEGVLKAGGKMIKTAATRGARARTFSYSGPGGFYTPADTGIDTDYTVGTTLEPYIKSKPAKQNWLQYVTGKIGKYVFGASVEKGEDEGTYIDETLAEKAGKYLKSYWEGAKEKARKYAGDFVEAIVTDGHEYDGHYMGGIVDEAKAEEAGVRRLKTYLNKGDSAVAFAVNNARRAA